MTVSDKVTLWCLNWKRLGPTTVVFQASMKEIIIMQKQQAAALDINILRRPSLSMKK